MGETDMTERERNKRIYIAGICAMVIEVLLCVLGGMQLLSGWAILIGALVCAVIGVYAYRLRECEQKNEALSLQLEQERAEVRQLQERLEQERQSSRELLEQERASVQRELVEVRLACEKRNEAFFSQVSHELRLPISVAVGYAELLRDGVVEDLDEQSEYLGKIVERLHYANELIGRNLSEVRDDAEDISVGLHKVSFDLVEFLRRGLEDFCAVTREKEIDCQLVTLEPSVMVQADPVLLQHVFDNLVENAMKYMGRPGTVTFMLARQDDGIVLTCRDDGLGMSSAQAAHIFENGFRGANTHDQTGSGHGLHLVDIIVHAHGGSCRAESEPGMGMRIILHLPILDQVEDAT